jgi:hypothetical protein
MSPLVRTLTIALALLVFLPTAGRAQDKHDKQVTECDPKAQPAQPTTTDDNDKDKNDKCKDPAEVIREQIIKERMEKEKGPSKSRFFEKVHVDALWIPGQTDAKFLGVVGAHVTVIEMGRVHLFGPPGVMVMRSDGQIRTALTWGFSLYLTQFKLPGTKSELALFGDFARAWTFGDYRTGTDLIGMSVAWRR